MFFFSEKGRYFAKDLKICNHTKSVEASVLKSEGYEPHPSRRT